MPTRRLILTILLLASLGGCGPQKRAADPPPAPAPTYRGPDFLRGTIGSLATLRGYRPILVSGYGFVVGLDGTGSGDCPPRLRQAMLREAAKRGIGRHQFGFEHVTPAQFLASDTTAVVRVEGVIPPGATENTRFDLLVTALPQTQTTSLAGGTLYTTELQSGGVGMNTPSGAPPASGRGSIFIDPFEKKEADDGDGPRGEPVAGRVLAGGLTNADIPLQLVLNRRSYRLTRQIADRINGRFPPDPSDRAPIAVPQSDTVITLNIIDRYGDDPQYLLDLLSHLYLNPTDRFAEDKARELAAMLDGPAHDRYAGSIAYALQGLGQAALPILRERYDHEDPGARLTALQAGARMEDLRAAEPLAELAGGAHGQLSERATRLVGELLAQRPNNPRVIRALRELLDAGDPAVRVAAFDALADANDPTIQRRAFRGKLEWAQVQCNEPMIYITQQGLPRIIVFNDRLGFEPISLFSAWDHHFMLRGNGGVESGGGESGADGEAISLFYQAPGRSEPIRARIPDSVAYLVGVMAFDPSQASRDRRERGGEKSVGLDLSYGQIVDILYQLTAEGVIDAPLVLQSSDLPRNVADEREAEATGERPETAPREITDTPRDSQGNRGD